MSVSQRAILLRRLVCILFAFGMTPAAFANALSFGPYNQGVYTGTPPFNTSGTCTEAGDDCGDGDTRIRSADIVSYAWSVAASGITAGDPDFTSVVMEQTLTPGANASVIFDSIPTICLAPPQGTGGSNPDSTILDNSDGSQTLICNLGSMGNGDQKSFTVPVRPLANSFNNSTFTTTQHVYALDAAGNKVVLDTGYVDTATYEISAAPAWDLIGDRRNLYEGGVTFEDMGTGRGSERGFFIWMSAHLGADVDRAGKGISALPASFDFNPLLTATTSDGVTSFPLEYSVTECRPNSSAWGLTVWGNESVRTDRDLNEHAVDSGTCVISGDPINGWTLTANDVNTLGTRYPTETINGTSLAAGPYFQMAYRLRIFVPFSEIDGEDTTPHSGSVNVTSCLSNFDPDDVANTSNYLNDYEPGYNGSAMPDGSKSNNCTGPLTLEISAKGTFSNYSADSTNILGRLIYPPMISAAHAGDGLVEPSEAYVNAANLSNSGSLGLTNVSLCTKFDNSTQQLTQSSDVGVATGSYAFVAPFNGALASEWRIEYASANISDIDPLDKDADNVNDFNAVSGRFEGDWEQLVDYDCSDPSLVWTEDPTSIGIDNVNIVRVSPYTPTITLDAGEYIRLLVPLVARDTFYGGSYAGQSIPVGTTLPKFSTWRSDEFQPVYRTTAYRPSPERSSKDGDRVTLTRVQIDVAKSTVTPQASAGAVTSTLAGNTVIWKIEPTISSILMAGSVADNAVVTDVLPSTLIYDHACTVAHVDGVEPTTVEYNMPSVGETTLTWSLGSPSSLASVTPIVFCTVTDATSSAGTTVVNSAFISADNAVTSNPATQTVTLGQAGSLQATTTVDVPTDLVDSDQIYTLKWFNFSTASIITAPTMINVLPHVGDGTSMSARDPASEYSGTLDLVGVPTVTWTDGSLPGSSDAFATLGTLYYSADTATGINHDPDSNTSNWCEYDGANFINPSLSGGVCPVAFSDVTAIKHVGNYDLETNGNPRQGLVMTYTLQANNNSSSDKYVNLFGLDSASLPASQYVIAKSGVVLVAAHSIGDFVFTDINNNGVYDAAIDLPAPDGITVELYDYATNTLLASVTTVNGTYLFDELEPGDFYVRIPETLFSPTGILNGWTAAINPQAANDDNNHTVDHNSFVTSHTNSIGVQSDLITLSLTPSLSGGAPVGDEPKGENIIPIADYSTRDDFSNLTVDLALVSADTDQDGILDVYEFGPEGIVSPLDSDDDGLLDYLDVDSDNDGLPDAYEYGGNAAEFADTDNDGVPNHLDIDSDNDGLKDSDEIDINTTDSDSDGIVDTFDVNGTNGVDNNGNGLDDAVELLTMLDTDQDGISDLYDLDSDNDGLTDAYESSGVSFNVDANGDGIVDQFTDANKDGMDDDVFSTPLPDLDTDSDGVVNHLDKDSDNDGISDLSEAGGVDANADDVIDNFADANQDGLNDDTAATPLADHDSDSDSIVNRLDIDSDNDGIPDPIEALGATATSTVSGVDTDNDGVPDYIDADADNDGVPDALEAPVSGVDTDNDGIDDLYDFDPLTGSDNNNDGIEDSYTVLDTDSDGIPDYLDLDTDNDGLPDALEVPVTTEDADNDSIADEFDVDETNGADSNNNGIDDSVELNGLLDSDGDGVADFRDLDADNDGLNDVEEAGGVDSDNDGIIDGFDDINKDGLNDTTAATALLNPDTDNDNTPDYLDVDSDDDGIPDAIEHAAAPANGDTDNDTIADHLDSDSDNDGISDSEEAPGSGIGGSLLDTDSDGIDDQYDVDTSNGNDINGDGIDDALFALGVLDTDNDGAPDYIDLDSDNDTINDITEARTSTSTVTDANNDGLVDNFTDLDGDGLDDNAGVNVLPDTDTNADGVPDRLELDSDGDGIPDAVESGPSAQLLDTDNDGISNYRDLDSDNDGIPDAIETTLGVGVDSDDDGIQDHLDLDSDNDGLTDTLEAGGNDVNGDGVIDGFNDANNNGIDDITELNALLIPDTDDDGDEDFRDTDSDNDTVSDTLEAGGADADADGEVDAFEDNNADGLNDTTAAMPLANPDTDNDGLDDRLDLDSDADTISDLIEADGSDTDTDADGNPDRIDTDSDNDGIKDSVEAIDGADPVDTDDDGVADFRDLDSDNDSLTDQYETADAISDTDDDGKPDYLDTDSDNDGIMDVVEAGGVDADNDGELDNFTDSNGDGLNDLTFATPVVAPDTDADGNEDHLDIDSDNDAVLDAEEVGAIANEPADTDEDGIPDYRDLDSDNDTINDIVEANGVDSNDDGLVDNFDDADSNGLDDTVQNSPLISPDTDNDGVVDRLDIDSDNDGLDDVNEDTIDTDDDGIPDYRDEDSDGDSINDDIENPLGTLDTDLDGLFDHLDLDSDNDGIPDSVEAGNAALPVDTDNDGAADYVDIDSDNDGIPDTVESQGLLGTVDTDEDGLADHLDIDSDNDGINDSIESQRSGDDVDADGIDDSYDVDFTNGTDDDNDGVDDAFEAQGILDSDADGSPDALELDSDNDGIPDAIEAGTGPLPADTDNDGTPDYLDTDSDNDGIDDAIEGVGGVSPGVIDTDGDTIPDYKDLDSDGDGLPDSQETGSSDTDEDGTPDFRDLDSDNDSLLDTVEAGGVDIDDDGMVDNFIDANEDGLDDRVSETPLATPDSDNDGSADHLDIDSDNDGISDSIESGDLPAGVDSDADGKPDYIDTDSDGDLIPDAIEAQGTPGEIDTDTDGIPDHLDTDSDNDGIDDVIEAQVSGKDSDNDGIDDRYDVDQTEGEDADADGVDDALEAAGTIDTDNDGLPDALELDSDGDGISDSIEAGITDGSLPIDTDTDGTPDYLDSDSDNDGIPDSIEAGVGDLPVDADSDGTPDYRDTDSDNDGLLDADESGIPDVIEAGTTDSSLPLDTDSDGIPDYQDIDSDNDGKGDTEEAGDTIPDTDDDGIPNHLDKDSDADGIPDAIENVSAINNGDSDDDGVEDYLDTDADNDGVSDELEAGHAPEDIDNDGIVDAYDVDQSNGEDLNGDGVDDTVAIIDTDTDGQPDYLDLDSDNDGIPDASEPAGVDSDNDGTPDRLDEDADNDGLSDVIEGNVDTDSDGTPDYLDLDSDNDGIPDETESTYLGAIPADKDADGIADYIDVDADNDGISDAYEGAEDSDGDGVADYRDLDVDNDGIFDIIEVRLGMDVVNLLDTNLDGVIDFSNSYGANGMADIVETVPESGIENYAFSDVDKDGVIDYNDLDSDNDGLLDTFESDHIDENFDGIIDASSPAVDTFNNNENVFADARQPSFALEVDETGLASGAGGVPRNTDNDGLADFRDPDSDNDGIMDIIESFGPSYDVDKDGAYDAFIDENGDGVSDNWQVNTAPIDTDQDGIVDAREADSDGDGISDVIETGGEDANADGVLDGFTDEDGDGVDDAIRLVGTVLIDTDNDGIPDYQDLDSDNDGISDIEEAGGVDADGDGKADAPVLAAAIKDTDQDGVPDYMQAGEEGFIHTGLQGSGCSILPENRASFKRYDPTFLIMLLMAMMVMAMRLYSRRAIQEN